MKLFLLCGLLCASSVVCMEKKEITAITLDKTEDLLKYASRKNLQDPAVMFIISEKLKSHFENPKNELTQSQKLTYEAVLQKIDPTLAHDSVEEELDALENPRI
ncbi:hypothetical protein Noda2021_08440 [Candidatus Dependentiae bacterium Noda2021]|nr:hypothetical protein Noda2021_08440 [Candidatus Dependentiae bacterium Noda2021]